MEQYSAALIVIFCIAVTVNSQQMVMCRVDRFCDQSPGVMSTLEDCCNHNTDPPGLAYTLPGVPDDCQLCPVVFGFNQTTMVGVERGESYTVVVGFRSGAPNATFQYSIEHLLGSASANDLRLSTTVGRFFQMDDATQLLNNSVTFTLIVDAVAQEENETFAFQLMITGDNPLGNIMIISILEGTILDGDTVPFFLSEDDYSESEAPGAAMQVRISKNQAIRLANPVVFRLTPLTLEAAERLGILNDVTITIPDDDVFSPNRASEADFNTTVLIETFPADEGGTTIPAVQTPVPIVDDAINEASEQIFVVLLEVIEATNPDLLNIQRRLSLCRILDNDPIQIGFALEQYNFIEPERRLLVRNVTLIKENDQISEQIFSIVITVSDPIATNVNPARLAVDYSLTDDPSTVNSVTRPFAATLQSIPFTFFLDPDNLPEGTEGFQVSSTPANTGPTFQPPIVNASAITAINIRDNDFAVVGFEQENYTISENGTQQEVCIVIFNPQPDEELAFNIILDYQTVAGSAVSSSDYRRVFSGAQFLSGPPGNTRRRCFDVRITNDTVYEEVESFTIDMVLSTFGGLVQSGTIVEPNVTEIFILDDDDVVIGFDNQPYTASEGDQQAFVEIGVLSGSLGDVEVAVELSLSDGTALFGGDYGALNETTFMFGPSDNNFIVNISLENDGIFELTEMLQATLSFLGEAPPRVTLSPESAQVTIFDDDEVEFGFNPATYTFNESVGNGIVTISHSRGDLGAGILAVLTVNTSDTDADNSTTAGEDYQPLVDVANAFSGSPSSVSLQIPITPDDITEGDELFQAFTSQPDILLNGEVRALSPQESSRVVLTQERAEITIADDDTVRIGFEPDEYVVDEDVGVLNFTIRILSGSLSRDVEVVFSTTDGSAVETEDYEATIMTVTFSPGVDFNVVSVPIKDDMLLEISEIFLGNLSFPSGMIERVTLDPSGASATIQDNDVVVIGFPQNYTVVEGADGSLTIDIGVLSGMLGRTVEVTVNTADGSAQDPDDYIGSSQVVTFTPDQTTSSIQVTINDDNILESPENFFARAESDVSGVIISPDQAMVTILDNDTLVIGFLDTYTVTEGVDNSVSIEIGVRMGTLGSSVEVRVFTNDGSAQAPGDYSSVSQTVTFTPDQTVQTIEVPINNDNILENAENFSARAETDNPGVMMIPDQTMVTILDNDSISVSFEQTSYDVTESDGVLNVTVVLMGEIERPVEVVINTEDSTAVSIGDEADYDPHTQILTFMPSPENRQEIVVQINIRDDPFVENDENLETLLSLPPGEPGVIIVNPESTINIIDDDMVTIGFNQTSYSVVENDPSGIVTVTVEVQSRVLRIPVTVNLSTSDISALAGSDYVGLGPFPLTFNESVTTHDILIPILNDDLEEPTESFSADLETSEDPDVVTLDPAMTTILILNDDVSLGTQVNDSVIGDPLFTVPILVPEEDLQALNISKLSLCYEIHGKSDQWFNLVTDECTTVNAQYVTLTPSLNIIDEIGVRAVDDNRQCVEILVDIDNCSASVNGADLAVMERYSSGGISVRRYSNRVRISVPNCAELTLVMWVTCERRSLDNPDDPGNMIIAEMIKFVIMRGLNFGHREAHGLLGQYWNVPVRVSQFDGLRQDGSTPLPSALVVNITTRGQTRGYAGWIADVTWDFSEGPCLYAGNRQGGPIREIAEPGDGVIESSYKDYQVESAFSEENYGFGMFDESRCIDAPPPSETTSPP